MLRAFVALLLLANIGFYAWSEGWLDSVVGARSIGDREPERMGRQVRPESVQILPPETAASSAVPVAFKCLEAGPFSDAEVAASQSMLQSVLPVGSWSTIRTDKPAIWIVYMGKYPTRDALSKKEDELNRRRVPFDEVLDNPSLTPGLSLGRFEERAAANRALDRFTEQGIRTARVAELSAATTSHLLRVEKADPDLAARVLSLKAGTLGKGFVACSSGPAATS